MEQEHFYHIQRTAFKQLVTTAYKTINAELFNDAGVSQNLCNRVKQCE